MNSSQYPHLANMLTYAFGELDVLQVRQPHRTGVKQLVHWTSDNVNLIVDGNHSSFHCLVVSKYAKALIPGDIPPVQKPGHSWSSRNELPDHTWDQSQSNCSIPVSNSSLTRTGQAVTLLNVSFYEPETTFKCLNEILYMLTLPALDDPFRDANTGNIKREWIFVVDNGLAEQPQSPLVS